MGEIEVGEYIRTKSGYIGKLLNYDENDIYFGDIECDFMIGGMPIEKENIKAHSKNIIDLIGKNDYVNGYKVIDICESQYGGEKVIYIGCFGIPKKIYDNQIKSILTKEKYEQNSYKL